MGAECVEGEGDGRVLGVGVACDSLERVCACAHVIGGGGRGGRRQRGEGGGGKERGDREVDGDATGEEQAL